MKMTSIHRSRNSRLISKSYIQEVLSQNLFNAEVRARQQKYTGLGINSVPSLIINDQYLLQGAQPAEAFEQALRQVAAQTA